MDTCVRDGRQWLLFNDLSVGENLRGPDDGSPGWGLVALAVASPDQRVELADPTLLTAEGSEYATAQYSLVCTESGRMVVSDGKKLLVVNDRLDGLNVVADLGVEPRFISGGYGELVAAPVFSQGRSSIAVIDTGSGEVVDRVDEPASRSGVWLTHSGNLGTLLYENIVEGTTGGEILVLDRALGTGNAGVDSEVSPES